MSYNGWSNYETWSVACYLQNDEYMYSCARNFARANTDETGAVPCGIYRGFVFLGFDDVCTWDNVNLADNSLNWDELDTLMSELVN